MDSGNFVSNYCGKGGKALLIADILAEICRVKTDSGSISGGERGSGGGGGRISFALGMSREGVVCYEYGCC